MPHQRPNRTHPHGQVLQRKKCKLNQKWMQEICRLRTTQPLVIVRQKWIITIDERQAYFLLIAEYIFSHSSVTTKSEALTALSTLKDYFTQNGMIDEINKLQPLERKMMSSCIAARQKSMMEYSFQLNIKSSTTPAPADTSSSNVVIL